MNHETAPPDEFWEDYVKVRTHFEWAEISMRGGDVDIPQAKLVVEKFGAFLRQWQSRIKDAEIAEVLTRLVAWQENLALCIERTWFEQLQQALEARRDWRVSELLFKASINYAALIKECPPHLLPELKRIYSDSMGKEYDPAEDFRDADASAEESEAKFRKELAKLECDWPERVDAALRERLGKVDERALAEWQKEVAGALGGVN